MKKLLVLLMVLMLVALPTGFAVAQDNLTIYFLDVGQADAAILQCGDDVMMIDGGNNSDSSFVYSYLTKTLGIQHIDYMIATHPHEDHIGGLSGALNACSVGTIYSPVTKYNSDTFSSLVKYANQQGLELTLPSVGETLSLGSASVQFLSPAESYSNVNDLSICVRIVHGNNSFLFAGDAEWDAEHAMVDSRYDLSADVLKVGHHGSDTSSSYVFLREVMPSYGIISVGEGNSYDHPSDTALSRLRDAGTTVFRTDLQGTIVCVSDGNTLTFRTSSIGEAMGVEVIFNAKKLRELLAQNDASNLSAETVVETICSIKRFQSSESSHFFIVQLDGVSLDSGLLDEEHIYEYLSQNAPIEYDSNKFSWAAVISQEIPAHTYSVCLKTSHGIRNIVKPYADTLLINRTTGETDQINDIHFLNLTDGEGCSIGIAWYSVSSFKGSIVDKSIKGLRLRVGICQLGERYNIREIAHDRWNATMMVQTLEDDGFTMVPFGQGFKDMSPPTKELMRIVLEHKLAHGGHPVLRWNMDNAYVRTDPAGNLKLDKEKSTEKVDGAVALVMALDRAMKNLSTGDSVYNHRGLLVL